MGRQKVDMTDQQREERRAAKRDARSALVMPYIRAVLSEELGEPPLTDGWLWFTVTCVECGNRSLTGAWHQQRDVILCKCLCHSCGLIGASEL